MSTVRPTLSIGAQGEDVVFLQGRLNAHGAGLVEDGDFGRATWRAVRAFQTRLGLQVDGVVGPRTWEMLSTMPEDDDPDLPVSWREALALQQGRQAWVGPARREVMEVIPVDASVGQRAAVTWMADLVGMIEDKGPNLGSALTPGFVDPYKLYWGISGTSGMAWCAMVAWAAYLAGLGGDHTKKADWKRLCPLRHWWGSAYDTWRVARDKGLWVDVGRLADLAASARLTGAILVARDRAGSDPARSAGHRWPGHVDLAVAWASGDAEVLALGGNLGDALKPVSGPASRYLGAVLFPASS